MSHALPTLSVDEARAALSALEKQATPEAALALFDRLPPMPDTAMIGAWVGSEITTGHGLNGALGAFHWHGKRFEGPEAVHPLVMRGGFALDPIYLSLSLFARWRFLQHPVVAALLRPTLRLLKTTQPTARLRAEAGRVRAAAFRPRSDAGLCLR